MLPLIGLAFAEEPAPEVVEVVAAARALYAGHVLTRADLRLAPLRETWVAPGMFHDPAALIGRTLLAPVYADAILRDARLAPTGRDGVDALVPPGWARVTLSKASTSILPGDDVDVVDAAGACVLVVAARVLATRAGGSVHIDPTAAPHADAVDLAVPAAVAPSLRATDVDQLAMLLRNPIDLSTTGPPCPGD